MIKNKSRFFVREREGSEGAPCPSRAVSGSPTFLEEGEDAAAPPQEAGCCLPPPGAGPRVCLDSPRSARHQARRPWPPRSSRRPPGHPFLPGSTRAAEHRVEMTALSSFRVPGDPSAARALRGHVPCPARCPRPRDGARRRCTRAGGVRPAAGPFAQAGPESPKVTVPHWNHGRRGRDVQTCRVFLRV